MPILAALFSFLFTFGHAQKAHQTDVAPVVAEASYAAPITDPVPSYEQIRTGNIRSSYAGRQCNSCTKTDVIFIVR